MPLTKEDVALRRTGLTASDMVALSGTVHFKRARTAHDVWMDKCCPELVQRTEISEAMELGNAAESLIVAQAARKLRMAVDYPQRSRRHREVPWKICTPDGIVVGNTEHVGVVQSSLSHEHMTEEGLLEAKLVGLHMAPYWDAAHENDEGPPEYVYVQVCWGMHVLDLPYAYVAAMIGTQIRTYKVEFGDGERELCEALTEIGEKFLVDHVRSKKPPPVDGSDNARRMLSSLHRRPDGIVIQADESDEAVARTFFEAKKMRAQFEQQMNQAEAHLMAKIGDHQGIAGDGWVANWRARHSYDVEQYHVNTGRVFAMKAGKR